MEDNKSIPRKVGKTIDSCSGKTVNTKKNIDGFDIENFVKDKSGYAASDNERMPAPATANIKCSDNLNYSTAPSVADTMNGFPQQNFAYLQNVEMQRMMAVVRSMDTKDEIINDLYRQNLNFQSSIQSPECIIQNDNGLVHVQPKKNGRYIFEPIANFLCRSVQQIQYIDNDTAVVVRNDYLITLVKADKSIIEFYMTQEDMGDDKLATRFQNQVCETLHLNGSNSEKSALIRNFLYSEKQKQQEIVRSVYPGFYLDMKKCYQFSYGSEDKIAGRAFSSNFIERKEIKPDYIFNRVEYYYRLLLSRRTKQLLYFMMMSGVMSSFTAKKFESKAPLFVFQCDDVNDADMLNAYVGGIFSMLKSQDKKLEDSLCQRRDGVASVCFSPGASKYLNETTKEKLLRLQENNRKKQHVSELILINVKNSVYFNEEVISETFKLEGTPDAQKVTETMQSYLQMFVEWILANQEWVLSQVAKHKDTCFVDCWRFVWNIAKAFLQTYKRSCPCFMEDADQTLEELLDIDPLDSYEDKVKDIRNRMIEELATRKSAFVTERKKRKFVVTDESNYSHNFYMNGDDVYINIEYFNALVRDVVGESRKVNELLRYMSEIQILSNFGKERGNKISVMTREEKELTRLNVWIIKKSLFGDTVLKMIGE